MLNISEPQPQSKGLFASAIFDLAFRSFFLLGSGLSCLALLLWLGQLHGLISLNQTGLSAIVWHTHEMLFGFAATIAVGFILTAVQTWTGASSVKGQALAILIAIWLLIRSLIWFNSALSVRLALLCTTIWWLLVILHFARLVLATDNQRNYLFIPILSVMAILNVSLLIADIWQQPQLALHLAKTMVLLFCMVMTLVAGRVIPFFTTRGANTEPSCPIPLLERYLLPYSAVVTLLYALSYLFTIDYIVATSLIVLGLLQLLRFSRWHSLQTLNIALLWSLHLAYLNMALGLILLGCSYFWHFLTFSSALHFITLGAMALMILAMISRVSLGHTGRQLVLPKYMASAFALLALAALLRSLLPSLGYYYWGWGLSAACWIFAFACFIWRYSSMLFKPRVMPYHDKS